MADQYTNQQPVAVVTVSDVEIGAVELKNSTTDDRAVVQAASSADATDIALTVADGNLHDSLGAVGAAADVDGVLHGQLRYVGEAVDNIPEKGTAAMAGSTPVTIATDDTQFGAVGAVAAADGSVHAQLRYVADYVDNIPAQGVALSAASLPIVLASDDAHLGAVGAAADADGVIHGQLRSIAENTDNLPTALGSAAGAASLPVALSTEDAAKVPALGTAIMTGASPVTLATDDTQMGAVGAASDVDGNVHGQLRYIGETVAAGLPASLGSTTAANSVPVTVATDDPQFGAVGAAAAADGTMHAQLRSIADNTDALPAALGTTAAASSLPVTLSTEDAAKVPALGVALSAASVPTVLASDDAQLGAVGAASDVDGNIHGQLRYIGEAVDALPTALGPALAAASVPITIATDDAHTGAVGAASDVDGVLHGQLRYIGEAVDALPTALGSAADAASLPVTQSTEDKAVLAGMSGKLPASLGSKAAAASLSVTQSTEDAAKIPALGVALSAASSPVVLASDDAHLGAVGAAADPDGVLHGQLRSIAENTDALPAALGSAAAASSLPVALSTEDAAKVPALGVALSAASVPVVLASDDAHLGAVGAASDVDGNVHGQLRYIGEAVDNIPAQGVANASASLPVTISTDDAHYGAVGAASDVDGVLHGQLRYVGETANTISADVDDIQSGTFFDCSTAGGSRSFTDTTAKTAGLAAGLYAVSSDQTCHIKTGPNASVEAAVGACTRLPADTVIGIVIDGTNDAIAAIREAVSGTLYYSKVG